MQEHDGNGGRKKDYFWLVIIVGIVVVTVGALFTGNYLARAFLTGDGDSGVVIQSNGDETQENLYVEPVEGETEPATEAPADPEEETAVAPPIASAKPADKPAEKPAENKETTSKPAPAPKPAPETSSEISIKSTAKAEVKKEVVTPAPESGDKTVTDAPPEDVKPVAVDPTKEESDTEEGIIYVLQLGVYGNKENAERMKQELEDEYKLEVYVAEVTHEGETRYRVQAGAFSHRENAEKLGRELQIKGYKFYISKQPMPR